MGPRLIMALLLGLMAACGGSTDPATSPTLSPVESANTEPMPSETTAATLIPDAIELERILAG